MDGPWYECQGPTAEQVREDVLKYINIVNKGNDLYEKEKDKIIEDAMLKIIPDSRNDFGSWRGYATFGVKAEIAKEVIKEIQRNYAILTIKNKFTPYVTHYLYKPNGIRMKQLAETTLVGKNSAIV